MSSRYWKRGCGKSVEQKDDGSVCRSGLAVENFNPIGFNPMVGRQRNVWNVSHGVLLLKVGWLALQQIFVRGELR